MHQSDAGSGVLADEATRRGVELAECLLPQTPAPRLDEFDALVVLGGSADVDEEARYPWMTAEKALIREALERGLPALGLCLGGQLLAEAAGARVFRLDRAEIGWRAVTAEPGARADPLFAPVPDPAVVFQWHHCAFELPPGAELLAGNGLGAQAFRLGRAWGVQFHPEVTAEIISGWTESPADGAELSAAGVDRHALGLETARRIGASMELGRGLFTRFLEFAAEAPVTPRPG